MVSTSRQDGTRPALRIVQAALLAVLITVGGSEAWAQAAAPRQKTSFPEAAPGPDRRRPADDVKGLVALFVRPEDLSHRGRWDDAGTGAVRQGWTKKRPREARLRQSGSSISAKTNWPMRCRS